MENISAAFKNEQLNESVINQEGQTASAVMRVVDVPARPNSNFQMKGTQVKIQSNATAVKPSTQIVNPQDKSKTKDVNESTMIVKSQKDQFELSKYSNDKSRSNVTFTPRGEMQYVPVKELIGRRKYTLLNY